MRARSPSSAARYLQLDDTSLAYLNDPAQREHIAQLGGDPEHQHETYIANINRALARPPGRHRHHHAHVPRQLPVVWVAAGGYDFVADALFNQLEVDGFFLEYDDERSGGFEPLRFVPKGKNVVLGLVTTKRAELESKDDLKRRIEEASKYVDARPALPVAAVRLLLDAWRATTLTHDEQFAKLELVRRDRGRGLGRVTAGVGAPDDHPSPSDRARELVRGGYDTHVHVAPDVVRAPRRPTSTSRGASRSSASPGSG